MLGDEILQALYLRLNGRGRRVQGFQRPEFHEQMQERVGELLLVLRRAPLCARSYSRISGVSAQSSLARAQYSSSFFVSNAEKSMFFTPII